MTDISNDFGTFLDQFRRQDEQNVGWMTTFHKELQRLAQKYRDVCRDLERERVAGRHTQEKAEQLDQDLKTLEESVLRSAFVLVLIDADADEYLFDDKYYIGDPADGGKRAAVDLKAAVRQYLKSTDASLAGLPIIVKAFASGEGLAILFAKAGIATQENARYAVSRFTSGFSQGDELFDFVLVGKGKDRADHKLMGAFRLFEGNPSCQRILLAGCHDNGYVRLLEKYIDSPAVVAKVTLLKSFQTGHEYATLPYESTTMETLFRNRPLGEMPRSTAPTHISATRGTTDQMKSAQVNGGGSTREAPGPATAAASAQAPAKSPTTYAAQLAATPSGRPLPLFGNLGQGMILVNAEGLRVDCPLPAKPTNATNAMHQKTAVGGRRYCNMYHLYGRCGGGCGYLHEYLSPAEKLVIRHRRRGEMCHERGLCRDPRCFYGHHCSCSKVWKCSFPANMHNVDVSTWEEVATA